MSEKKDTTELPESRSAGEWRLDEKQIYAVVHRPPNVPESLMASFIDLYGKAYGVYLHTARVREWEERDRVQLEKSLSRITDHHCITLARTASMSLRSEFEALLGAGYSLLNVLTRAVCETLLGQSLEGEDRLPTLFGPRENGLEGFLHSAGVPEVRRKPHEHVLTALKTISGEAFEDIVSGVSPRHRVVHREHLRCKPAQASTSPHLRIESSLTDLLNPRVLNSGPPIPGLNVVIHGVPDVGFCDYVLRTDQPIPSAHRGPMRVVLASEARRRDAKSLSLRAREFGEAHMRAAALLLDAISDGEDLVTKIVPRMDAARRAFGSTV